MKKAEIRQKLIEGTITVIANEGLDKASTKQIGLTTSVNEAYIYRCFKDKEDLLAKTFDSLDEELLAKTMQFVEVMYMSEIEYETRCRVYFFAVWKFLLSNREKCLTYMRYFYSTYFIKYSADIHKERFAPLVSKFDDALIEEADTWLILNHILNVILDFAIKVHNNQMPDKEIFAEHVFRVIYTSIKQYFKERPTN
ncbi:MAG: TetR/AcrR family transcriptional regulator [Ruminococcaceae bacterium]|nr:TetR/AcrR family transcriptional regulator [Oscillospiraceae bacterium]